MTQFNTITCVGVIVRHRDTHSIRSVGDKGTPRLSCV